MNCLICHTNEAIKSPCCSAYYHTECLLKWMEKSSKCPHCNHKLESKIIYTLKIKRILFDLIILGFCVISFIKNPDKIRYTLALCLWTFICNIDDSDIFNQTNWMFFWIAIIYIWCNLYYWTHVLVLCHHIFRYIDFCITFNHWRKPIMQFIVWNS